MQQEGSGATLTNDVDENQPNKEFILLCRPSGQEILLKHANVTNTPCDRSTYEMLHRKHFGKYHIYIKWMYLTEISSVDFTKV